MVARFHEGCLHRRVDGQIEEFIFTEASHTAVESWAEQIERLMASGENPKVARWLIDLRLSGPLPLDTITKWAAYLQDCSGTVGRKLSIAYLTDAPETFEELFSSLHGLFEIETRARWFNSNVSFDQRSKALEWLMQQN